MRATSESQISHHDKLALSYTCWPLQRERMDSCIYTSDKGTPSTLYDMHSPSSGHQRMICFPLRCRYPCRSPPVAKSSMTAVTDDTPAWCQCQMSESWGALLTPLGLRNWSTLGKSSLRESCRSDKDTSSLRPAPSLTSRVIKLRKNMNMVFDEVFGQWLTLPR